jgi:hypothetical protein
MDKEKDIKTLLEKLRMNKIEELSKKKGIPLKSAQELLEKEERLDKEIKDKIISDALLFKFEKETITKFIDPRSIESKRRIRYLIQNALGSINFVYRNLHLIRGIHSARQQSKKLKDAYHEAKDKIWHLRYQQSDYFELLINVFNEYLNKSYVIFFEFLTIQNRNNLHETTDFSKENILKSVLISPLLEHVDKLKKEFVEELDEELKVEFDKMFDDIWPNENERNNYSFDDGPYCSACQQAPCMCSDPERTSTVWPY